MAISIVLLILLWFGAVTIWVEGRWAVSLLEAGVFLAAGAALALGIREGSKHSVPWPAWCLAAVAAWGLIQMAFGLSVAPSETEWAALYWIAAACFVGLGAAVTNRASFLQALVWSGTIMAALCLAQMYTSGGKILWLVPTPFSDRIFGTFANYNNYAAFIELIFPIALWRALKEHRQWRLYAGVSALLYSSVVASTSRAGTILVTLELVTLIAATYRSSAGRKTIRRGAAVLTGLILFTLVAGYETTWRRFLQPDPYSGRREFQESALAMIQARPLTGFGLGTWTSAYPAYAIADFGVVANHAHSEWLQWSAEGGLVVAGVMLALLLLAVWRGVPTIWGIGLVAVLLHALIDYPLVRLGLGSWWFTMLGLVYAEGQKRRSSPDQRLPSHPKSQSP